LILADVASTSRNYVACWEWLVRLHLITRMDWHDLITTAGLTPEQERSFGHNVFPGLARWVAQEHGRHRGMFGRAIRQAWATESGWWRRAGRLARVPFRAMLLLPTVFRRLGAKLLWTRDYVLIVASR
jgi:hypothetical protein